MLPQKDQWKNLTISNDFIFAKVMRNPELCKKILELLLEVKIKKISYPEEQKIIDITADSKSVRLDVYLQDDAGTVYNVEIQAVKNKNLPKRSRYYSSMLDLNAIEKGTDYKKLPQSFVIFICTFDLFGKNRLKYTFLNQCLEDSSLKLGDGTTKIFFNTTGTEGELSMEAKRFLKFIENNKAEDNFTKDLEQEILRIKENKEWRAEYMTLFMKEQEKYEEGWEKGREEGREEESKNLILNMQQKGYSLEVIADVTNKNIEQIKTIIGNWNL